MKTVSIRAAIPGNWPRLATAFLITILIVAIVGCGGQPAPITTTPPSPTPTATPSPSPAPTPPATTKPTTTTPAPPPRYTLDIAISPSDSGNVTPSRGTYDAGTQATLRATPASACWAFDRWSGDASGNITSVLLTLNGSKSVTANFVKVRYVLSVNVTPPGSGSVGPNGGTYDCGESVRLAAAPGDGYDFDHWGGDISGTANVTSITMQSNKNVTAFFKSWYQTIKRDTRAGSMALNTITYSTELKVGDRIQGFVELTGERHPEDAVYSWNFSITGPQTIIVENWEGNVLTSQRHDFDKTVQFAGTYVMKMSHTSRWAKDLTIQIRPGGWLGG